MNDKLILASYDKGITRATCTLNDEWEVQHLASGHRVTRLAANPADPNILFAATRSGVLRSADRGLTWEDSGMQGRIVKSIAVSRQDPDVIYAGTKPALLYVSRDGGRSWRELEGFRRVPNRWWWFSPAEPPDLRAYVIDVVESPAEPHVLLAGIEFGAVLRSEDGGETWSRHRSGALRDCHSLKFHASDGAWAYEAGGTGRGVAFSQDGGRTFHKKKAGLAKNYGIVCGADAVDPATWYVCVAPSPMNAFGEAPEIYLYRSRNGDDWEPIGWQAHPLPMAPTALVSLAGVPGSLIAGLRNGDIWHSTDYGDTWQQVPVNMRGIWFSLLVLDRGS